MLKENNDGILFHAWQDMLMKESKCIHCVQGAYKSNQIDPVAQ